MHGTLIDRQKTLAETITASARTLVFSGSLVPTAFKPGDFRPELTRREAKLHHWNMGV